jgi:hypothetical protein
MITSAFFRLRMMLNSAYLKRPLSLPFATVFQVIANETIDTTTVTIVFSSHHQHHHHHEDIGIQHYFESNGVVGIMPEADHKF